MKKEIDNIPSMDDLIERDDRDLSGNRTSTAQVGLTNTDYTNGNLTSTRDATGKRQLEQFYSKPIESKSIDPEDISQTKGDISRA
jgi:hypothetical protein